MGGSQRSSRTGVVTTSELPWRRLDASRSPLVSSDSRPSSPGAAAASSRSGSIRASIASPSSSFEEPSGQLTRTMRAAPLELAVSSPRGGSSTG